MVLVVPGDWWFLFYISYLIMILVTMKGRWHGTALLSVGCCSSFVKGALAMLVLLLVVVLVSFSALWR